MRHRQATQRYQRLIIVSIGSLVVSCAPVAPPVDPQILAHGQALYHTLACDSCHALAAVGSTRTYAPTHNHLPATAEQRIHAADCTGQATTVAEYIRESIVDTKAYVVAGYDLEPGRAHAGKGQILRIDVSEPVASRS